MKLTRYALVAILAILMVATIAAAPAQRAEAAISYPQVRCGQDLNVYGRVDFPIGTVSFSVSLEQRIPGSGWIVLPGSQQTITPQMLDTFADFGPLSTVQQDARADRLRVVNTLDSRRSNDIQPCRIGITATPSPIGVGNGSITVFSSGRLYCGAVIQITASVRHADGSPAPDGTLVTFQTSLGFFGQGNNIATVPAYGGTAIVSLNNGQGVFYANGQGGLAYVQATANGLVGSTTVVVDPCVTPTATSTATPPPAPTATPQPPAAPAQLPPIIVNLPAQQPAAVAPAQPVVSQPIATPNAGAAFGNFFRAPNTGDAGLAAADPGTRHGERVVLAAAIFAAFIAAGLTYGLHRRLHRRRIV